MKKYTLLLGILVLLVSCASFNPAKYENQYYTSIEMYVETMTSINKSYSEGNLSIETYNMAISYANSFQNSARLAKYALEIKNYESFITNMNSAQISLDQLGKFAINGRAGRLQ